MQPPAFHEIYPQGRAVGPPRNTAVAGAEKLAIEMEAVDPVQYSGKMRQCVHCSHCFSQDGWKCPRCGKMPARCDGFLAFAPDMALRDSGFRSEYFSELAALEDGHFWFSARADLICWALRTYASNCERILEIGCGTGYMLSALARASPNARVSGSEVLSAGLPFAAKRVPRAQLFQMDARRIPFFEEFDVVGAFDVLEHIVEDELVLGQMWQALVPRGRIVVTVPQHGFLWSEQDEYAHHVRRYGRGELERKVMAAGFRIELSTSFVSLLLPLLILSRLRNWRSSGEFDALAELRIGSTVNSILRWVMGVECALIRAGCRPGLGGSRLLVASK